MARTHQEYSQKGKDQRNEMILFFRGGSSDVGKMRIAPSLRQLTTKAAKLTLVSWIWELIKDNHVKRSRVRYSDATESE